MRRSVADIQRDMRRAKALGDDEMYVKFVMEKIEALREQARIINGRKLREIYQDEKSA